MHRPNRIGEHHIADLSADDFTLDASIAEFAASLGTHALPQVQTDTATLGDPVSTVNFTTEDILSTWLLSAKKSYSFGRFISGAAINEREVMISYSLNAQVVLTGTNRDVMLSCRAGMANATSVTVDKTAQVNLMDTSCLLAMQLKSSPDDVMLIQAKGTFVNTVFNGGASGLYDTNPLGVWLQIDNIHPTTNATIHSIFGSLSIYRYSKDIDTFDPTR